MLKLLKLTHIFGDLLYLSKRFACIFAILFCLVWLATHLLGKMKTYIYFHVNQQASGEGNRGGGSFLEREKDFSSFVFFILGDSHIHINIYNIYIGGRKGNRPPAYCQENNKADSNKRARCQREKAQSEHQREQRKYTVSLFFQIKKFVFLNIFYSEFLKSSLWFFPIKFSCVIIFASYVKFLCYYFCISFSSVCV